MKGLIENGWTGTLDKAQRREGGLQAQLALLPHPDPSRQQDGRFCLGPDPVPVFQAGLGLAEAD